MSAGVTRGALLRGGAVSLIFAYLLLSMPLVLLVARLAAAAAQLIGAAWLCCLASPSAKLRAPDLVLRVDLRGNATRTASPFVLPCQELYIWGPEVPGTEEDPPHGLN